MHRAPLDRGKVLLDLLSLPSALILFLLKAIVHSTPWLDNASALGFSFVDTAILNSLRENQHRGRSPPPSCYSSFAPLTSITFYGPQYYYTLATQGFAGWGDKDSFVLALKALHEDYYMVPFDLETLFIKGTITGVAMMQADSANQTGYEPSFLHTNRAKWNPRAFLCIGCANDKEEPVQTSDLEGESSSIHQLLVDHRRIYAHAQTKKYRVNPKALLWKSMEHNILQERLEE